MPNVNKRETMKKEKVVAVRLTKEQWEALEWGRVNIYKHDPKAKTMSQFLAELLKPRVDNFSQSRHDILKREEAAAKRKATREAKKAANDPK